MNEPHIRAALQRRDRLAWRLGMTLVLAVFAFDLLSVLAPGLMALPVGGGTITAGVVSAFAIVTAVIGVAVWFVRRLDRADPLRDPRDR